MESRSVHDEISVVLYYTIFLRITRVDMYAIMDYMGIFGDIIRLPGEIIGGIADVIEDEIEDIFD